MYISKGVQLYMVIANFLREAAFPTTELPVVLGNLPSLGQYSVWAFVKGIINWDYFEPLVEYSLQLTTSKRLIPYLHTPTSFT